MLSVCKDRVKHSNHREFRFQLRHKSPYNVDSRNAGHLRQETALKSSGTFQRWLLTEVVRGTDVSAVSDNQSNRSRVLHSSGLVRSLPGEEGESSIRGTENWKGSRIVKPPLNAHDRIIVRTSRQKPEGHSVQPKVFTSLSWRMLTLSIDDDREQQ